MVGGHDRLMESMQSPNSRAAGWRGARALGAAVALGLLVTGCGPYEPIIDRGRAGFNEVAYQQDLAQCRAYAEQISLAQQAGTGGAIGAATGAAFGAIGDAFAGSAGTGAALGASLGGLSGVLGGGADASQRQDSVVRNCLAGRGYAVLD